MHHESRALANVSSGVSHAGLFHVQSVQCLGKRAVCKARLMQIKKFLMPPLHINFCCLKQCEITLKLPHRLGAPIKSPFLVSL